MQERENERRVIHIEEIDEKVTGALRYAGIKFSKELSRDHHYKSSQQHSVTYLFNSVEGADFFGECLDDEGVAYSTHPAKEYDDVATRDMNNLSKLLHEQTDITPQFD